MPATSRSHSSYHAAPGLPDPVTEAHFYAGVTAKRLIAWLFDAVFVAILCLIVLPFTAFTALFFFPLLWLVVGFLYRWATIAGGSATWGMRLMSIELRESDGLRLSGGTAFVHTLGYTVSVAMAPLQLISVLIMLALGRGQGLTDMLLGTAMINRPAD
jgi:uncharacterized RDD family membrane protein YckC